MCSKGGIMKENKKGRKPLNEQEKAEKKQQLKNEPKDVKFKRLINPRMQKTLHCMKTIKSLAGNQYQHTDEQTEKILRLLNEAIQEIDQAYNKKSEQKTLIEI